MNVIEDASLSASSLEDGVALNRLIKAGMLLVMLKQFSCQLAIHDFSMKNIMPTRNLLSKLWNTCQSVVELISPAEELQNFPKEATIQHLFMQSLLTYFETWSYFVGTSSNIINLE